MHDDEPQRLKKQQEAPPDLVRALEALRKGTDEKARLERVAAKLGALLDAPPPAAPSVVGGVTSALLRRAAFKLIIGGLAVLVPAAWMIRSSQSAKLQDQKRASEQAEVAKLPDAAQRDAAVAAQADSALYAAGARALAPESVAGSQKQEQTVEPVNVVRARRYSAKLRRGSRESGRVTDRSSAERLVGAKQTETALRGADAKQAEAHDRSSSSERAEEVARREEEAERSARAKQAGETERSASSKQAAVERSASRMEADEREPSAPSARNPQQAEAQKPAPTRPTASDDTASESALLFEARKAMASDASVALRVLEDHARRYPKGALVPEREVLAIEALRALGRTAEAEARLQRFEARYPGSLYLGRLRR